LNIRRVSSLETADHRSFARIFSDSFFAAKAALWDKHDPEATFREGQILVLMSMDPHSAISQQGRAEVEAKVAALRARMEALHITSKQDLAKLAPKDLISLIKADQELKEVERKAQQAPRGIVTHPAVFGRELACSAGRADFWFNLIGDLSKEAAMINGGREMPAQLRDVNIAAAGTWQFYEVDSVVKLGGVEGKAQRLIVGSNPPGGSQESLRSHFGVSMFALTDSPPDGGQLVEDGVYRLRTPGREETAGSTGRYTGKSPFKKMTDFQLDKPRFDSAPGHHTGVRTCSPGVHRRPHLQTTSKT
jgi:hypothetical protein